MGAKLSEKTGITKLVLDFSSEEEEVGDHDDVLKGLEPHSNLKGLILQYYKGENCPSWMLTSDSSLGEFSLPQKSVAHGI